MADLEDLYRRHVGAAMKAAWLVTNDADAAGELVQAAFVRCAGRIAGIRDLTGFGRYWQQAVLRSASNERRRHHHERTALSRLAVRSTQELGDAIAVRISDRIVTDGALSTLSVRSRAVVVCRFYLDMSEAQTADALNMRLGTVKSTTARALAALRVAISEEAPQ